MKVLILGANGLIGQSFSRFCRVRKIKWEGTCYSRSQEGLIPFNLGELENIPEFFDRVAPTLIINATGLAGGVNFCEENPGEGYLYHVKATQVMADWCAKNQVTYVFFSTDYVFDGSQPFCGEGDTAKPINLYGKYKHEAEVYILKNLKRFLVIRTTNVFGWDKDTKTPNFLMWLYKSLEKQNIVKVPGYLFGTPTYVGDLTRGVMELLTPGYSGLFHIVGSEYINRYEWARKYLEIGGIKDKQVEKIEEPLDGMVPRPKYCRLSTDKFSSMSRIKLRGVNEGLRLFFKEMKKK